MRSDLERTPQPKAREEVRPQYNMKKEIKIVGAGISGLTAAINLARAGYRVKVFEKNNVVGKRFHGDYQGIENWIYKQDALEHLRALNIRLDFPCRPVREGYDIGPDKKVYNLKSDRPFFYLVRRGINEDTLDQALYRQAKSAGVEIIFNSPKDHCKFGDIIAQGYFPDQVTDAIAAGYTFQTSVPEQYWAIIDDQVAPDSYAYCLIAEGRATLAVCIFRDYDKSYVGEAAGLIDGLWGFGIKYAMISGYLAAQSIIENKNYNQLVKKTLFSPLIASLVNRWYYKCLNRGSYQLILRTMKKVKDPVGFLRKRTNYSLIHKIGFPFAYFALRKKLKDRRKFK